MDPAKGVMVMRSVLWRLNQLADAPGPMWESIYCSRKVAYGCGRHGQKVVEGITLFRSLPDHQDVTSSMTIRLSAEAIGIVKADLGLGSRSALQAQGFVQAASEGLLVLAVNFSVHNPSNRGYYLVYDSTDASLYMTPCLPTRLVCSYTPAPVPRRIDGGGSEPQLVLLAHPYRSCHPDDEDLLCLCTPAARSPGITDRLWDIKALCFPHLHLPGSFNVQVTFSFQGKVFWADLSQGLAYCDLRAATNSAVQFDFINLPYGYEIHLDDLPEDGSMEPPEMDRTIGCIGGCIKFICIDRPRGRSGNWMLRFWTLDLGRKKWQAEEGLLWKELWEQIDFMGSARLWDVEPRYPVLMPDDTLCLVLEDMRHRRVWSPVDSVEVDCICRFDIFSKTPVWHGKVGHYSIWPVMLPGDFFTKCYPPPDPRKSQPLGRKRKLQSIVASGSCKSS